MARPYSLDLRKRMVRAVLSGQSRREVARLLEVGASFLIKLIQRRDATGECRPRKFGGHKRHALAGHADTVRALVAKKPDLTIGWLWQKITALGIKVGRSAVARFLLRAGAPGRQALRRAQEPARRGCEMQKSLDPRRLVFIDETFASTKLHRAVAQDAQNCMTPRYGRCERGKRLVARADGGDKRSGCVWRKGDDLVHFGRPEPQTGVPFEVPEEDLDLS